MTGSGTYATFPDGRRKAGISPKPDIAVLYRCSFMSSRLAAFLVLQLGEGA
jgi:hypothetical protein